MANIIEAANLPEGEKVYLKKDIFGWRTVQPIKIDGKLNLWNLILGGKRNALGLLLILLLAAFLIWSYKHDITAVQNNYANISTNPFAYCNNINANPLAYQPRININNSYGGG